MGTPDTKNLPTCPPQAIPLLDARGGDTSLPLLMANQWWLPIRDLFNSVRAVNISLGSTDASIGKLTINDTRANRVNYAAANYPNSVYFETDTLLTYSSLNSAWIYKSGVYKVFQSAVVAFIATLTANDVGLRMYVSDFAHTLWCTAAATSDWAPEDPRDAGILGLFDVAPSTGWHLLDGTGNIAILKSDGTTRNNANAAALNVGTFFRGAAAFNGAITAAVAPTISTPTFTGSGGTTSGPTGTATINNGTGGAVLAANTSHTHTFTAAGTVSAPTATLGGPPVAFTDWLPYIRK